MTLEAILSLASFLVGILVTLLSLAVKVTISMSRYITRDDLEKALDASTKNYVTLLEARLAELEAKIDGIEKRFENGMAATRLRMETHWGQDPAQKG